MQATCALLVLFCVLVAHGAPSPYNRYEFKTPDDHISDLEKEVTLLAKETIHNGTCPDLDIAATCGDGKCQPQYRETKDNCPMDCSGLWSPYSHQVFCKPTLVAYPTTIAQVIHFVHEATRTNNTIRACGAGHSTNSACCTDGILLVMKNMNKFVGIKTDANNNKLVTVEAGMTMEDLYTNLDKNDLAVGYAVPGYRRMTVAGVISTGSHGSSPLHTSVVSSLVQSLDVITPWGEMKTYSADQTDDQTWRALRASLGMLGIIVRVTLIVQPKFSLSFSWNSEFHNSDLFAAASPADLLKGCDFGVLHWWPNQDNLVRVCGMNTTEAPDETIQNSFVCVPGTSIVGYPVSEMMQIANCNNKLKGVMEELRHGQFVLMPYFSKKNFLGLHTSTTAGVGNSYMVISDKGCDPEPWDRGFVTYEYEVALPLEHATDAFKFIHKYLESNEIHLPMFGFFLRFGPSQDTTLLAHSVGRSVCFMDFVEYHVKGVHEDQFPAYNVKQLNALLTLLIEKFGARVHWGKNIDEIFAAPYAQKAFGTNWDMFQEEVKKADPHCLFRSDFTQSVGFPCSDKNTASYSSSCAACASHMNEVQLVCGKNQLTYLHPCSASCDGLALDTELLQGSCESYNFYEKIHEGALYTYAFKGNQFVKAWML